MAEDGIATLLEFQEIFTELGGADMTCFLRTVSPGQTPMSPKETTDLDIQAYVRINEPQTLKTLAASPFAYALSESITFTIWGGVLDPNGDSSLIEPLLRSALDDKGGIVYGGQLLKITGYHRGLSVGGVIMEWMVLCKALR